MCCVRPSSPVRRVQADHREIPSKAVDPSNKHSSPTMPGCCGIVASPASGFRSSSRPSAPRPNGLSRASTSAYTSKLSPIAEPGRPVNDARGNIHQRVARHEDRDDERLGAVRVRELEPEEAGQSRRPPASTRSPSGNFRYDDRRARPRDRAQRVGQSPDRAAEQGERDDADPDPHVEPGRRRVQRRRTAAEPCGAEQQRERRQTGELQDPRESCDCRQSP